MRVEADLLEGEQEQWHDSLQYVLEFRQNISWGVVLFQGALQERERERESTFIKNLEN